MFYRKLARIGLVFFWTIGLILGGIIFYSWQNRNDLEIIFLDVGQGDAILITQGNRQTLIDGGRNGKLLLNKLGKYIPFWDREIEAVIVTHPDQDHIAGLIDVFKNYQVGAVIRTGARSEAETFRVFEEKINQEKAENVGALKNVFLQFPQGPEIKILYPFSLADDSDKNNSNAGSVAVKLAWGKNSFIFTGDLPGENEIKLVNENFDLKTDVLKIAHHGSKYSTTEEFLNAVQPEDAIISVGKNNTYGHPGKEVIDRLLARGTRILRTDEMGDLRYECKTADEKCALMGN